MVQNNTYQLYRLQSIIQSIQYNLYNTIGPFSHEHVTLSQQGTQLVKTSKLNVLLVKALVYIRS